MLVRQQPPLTLRESADVDNALRLDAHALPGAISWPPQNSCM
jgi:hypothetical protein